MSNFLDTLRLVRGGLVLKDAERQLEQLIYACQESGAKGEINIKLKFEPHGKDNKEMHVQAICTNKTPAAPGLQDKSIFFAVRGSLVRDDPEQALLPGLRAVDEGNADGSSPSEQRRAASGPRGNI